MRSRAKSLEQTASPAVAELMGARRYPPHLHTVVAPLRAPPCIFWLSLLQLRQSARSLLLTRTSTAPLLLLRRPHPPPPRRPLSHASVPRLQRGRAAYPSLVAQGRLLWRQAQVPREGLVWLVVF